MWHDEKEAWQRLVPNLLQARAGTGDSCRHGVGVPACQGALRMLRRAKAKTESMTKPPGNFHNSTYGRGGEGVPITRLLLHLSALFSVRPQEGWNQ